MNPLALAKGQKPTHSDRLERWLGAAEVASVSAACVPASACSLVRPALARL